MILRELSLNQIWKKISGWFLVYIYFLANLIIFFNHVKDGLDGYRKFYDEYMVFWDFNSQKPGASLSQCFFKMNTKSVVHEPTYLKSLSNQSCTDLFIINSSSNFLKIWRWYQRAYLTFIKWLQGFSKKLFMGTNMLIELFLKENWMSNWIIK